MKYPALLLVGICAFNSGFSQIIKTLEVDFIRSYREGNRYDKTSGHIYYQSDGIFSINVLDPVHQWMIAQPGRLIIYYPDENKIFHFPTDSPFNFPFFQAFLGVVKEDYGLTDLGFKLTEHKAHEETLLTIWSPPDALRRRIGNYLLITCRKKILAAELLNPDSTVQARSDYGQHIEYSNIFFPLEIITTRNEKDSVSAESISYSHPVFNEPLPDSVVNFAFPDDIEIEEITW